MDKNQARKISIVVLLGNKSKKFVILYVYRYNPDITVGVVTRDRTGQRRFRYSIPGRSNHLFLFSLLPIRSRNSGVG